MSRKMVAYRGVGVLAVLLLWAIGQGVWAQSNGGSSVTIQVENAPLGRALERAAATAGIGLVYDFTLVRGRRVTCRTTSREPSVLLRCLLDQHPIDYIRTSEGTYVLREAVRQRPQRGRLTGRVRAEEENRALHNAHVQFPESAEFAGTITDSTGRYRLSGLLPGPHTVVISHLGYKEHRSTVYIPPNATARHDVTLPVTPIDADSVVVDAERSGSTTAVYGDGRVSSARLARVGAGGTPDVLDAASSLLGVTTSAPYTDLHIQSGATGGHTLRLDGVSIRNPASAGRLLGAFSPLAIDGLTARKAGFGVLHGDAVSGTVELAHDLSARSADYGSLRLDPRSLNTRLRGSAELDGNPVTGMVAARVSLWDVHQDEGLRELINRWSTLDPVLAAARLPGDRSPPAVLTRRRAQPSARFYDLHGAVRFDHGPSRHAYVSAYRGVSQLGADLMLGEGIGDSNFRVYPGDGSGTSGIALPTRDEYSWSNTGVQFRYESPVTARTTGTFQASLSHYRGETTSDVGSLTPMAEGENVLTSRDSRGLPQYGEEGLNEIMELAVEGRLDIGLSARSGLTIAGKVMHEESRFRISNVFAPRIEHRAQMPRLMAATKASVGVGKYSSMEAGVRVTGMPGQGRIFVEPRGTVQYDRSLEDVGRVLVHAGGGVYRQFTTQLEFSRDGATAVVPTSHIWLPVPSSLSPARAYHLAGGITWQPDDQWQVDLEGYRKWQPHLLAIDYPVVRQSSAHPSATVPPSQFLSSSRGYAYGGGVHAEYDASRVTGEVRYSFSQARRTFPGRFGGRYAPVPWLEPHRVTVSADISLGSGIALEAKGESVWGRKWGFRRAYYAYLTPDDLGSAWDRTGLDRPGDHALSPLRRLDLGVTVTQSWRGVQMEGRVGLVNVMNRKNVADWALKPGDDDRLIRLPRSLPGRRATVSVQLRY